MISLGRQIQDCGSVVREGIQIGVVGVNHHSAKLGLRERLAKACEGCLQANGPFRTHPFVLLSTCNRVEIYFSGVNLQAARDYFTRLFHGALGEEAFTGTYSHIGAACFWHLAHATAGLGSRILGETEIQGQVKRAYQSAQSLGKLSPDLHFLFQKSLKLGKDLRSSFRFDLSLPTLEKTIFNALEDHFDDPTSLQCLFVGASAINLKVLRGLRCRGVQDVTLCNRMSDRAKLVAAKERLPLQDWNFAYRWHEFDAVIFGTRCPAYIVTEEQFPSRIESKRLLFDLSVPRNVEPSVGERDGIHLFNVDELGTESPIENPGKSLGEWGQLSVKAEKTLEGWVAKQVEIFSQKIQLRSHSGAQSLA